MFGGYPASFLLVIGATPQQVERALSKVPDGYVATHAPRHRCAASCWATDDGAGAGLTLKPNERGRMVVSECGDVALILREHSLTSVSVATVAHECFHLVYYIAGEVGIPLGEDSEEAWAFMLADVVESVIAAIAAHRSDGRKVKRRR
jgi:hypothetical protein